MFIIINKATDSIIDTQQIQDTPIAAEEIVIKEERFIPYNIPLSVELQEYTYILCQDRGLDFEIVLALIYVESSFRPNVISEDNYGLMQINSINHKWLSEELGITDFLDPYQNINAGTYMLSSITDRYSDIHQVLMVYNFGEAGAMKQWDIGNYSSSYSNKIITIAGEFKRS